MSNSVALVTTSFFVTTSKAPVTTSDALVTSSVYDQTHQVLRACHGLVSGGGRRASEGLGGLTVGSFSDKAVGCERICAVIISVLNAGQGPCVLVPSSKARSP